MNRDFDEVYHELQGVESGDDVHRLLKLKGIRGLRSDGRSCPVSNYIKKECGLTSVFVGSRIVPDFVNSADIQHGYLLPVAVRGFITQFDNGYAYQDLDEEYES